MNTSTAQTKQRHKSMTKKVKSQMILIVAQLRTNFCYTVKKKNIFFKIVNKTKIIRARNTGILMVNPMLLVVLVIVQNLIVNCFKVNHTPFFTVYTKCPVFQIFLLKTKGPSNLTSVSVRAVETQKKFKFVSIRTQTFLTKYYNTII